MPIPLVASRRGRLRGFLVGRWLLAFAALVWLVVATDTSVRAAVDEEEDEDDESGFPWPEWFADADLEFTAESQGDESSTELTFDEVSFGLEDDRWGAEASVKYESEGGGLLLEEAALRVGGTETWPWFLQIGRTFVSFGEYESGFVEDPLTALVGETDQDAITVGYGSDELELALSFYRGEHAGDGDLDLAASVKMVAFEAWTFGLSWSSDLGEAAELVDLRQTFREEQIATRGVEPEVGSMEAAQAASGFAAWKVDRWKVRFEAIAGLSSLAPGTLAETSVRPRAWNLEIETNLGRGWTATPRLEFSQELPESPRWQSGVAMGFQINENLKIVADYLRGDYSCGVPDRDLLSAQLSFEY